MFPSSRMSRRAAFYLQSSIVLFFLAGSAAPTPLYGVYQQAWGFSPITTTFVFGIYALAVLSALLIVGSLSDHIGRRPVLLVATVLQAATMLLFATADGVGALVAARVIQGLSTGAAAAAVGAGLLDLDRARGTTANAVFPMLGTATGGIVSGLMIQYLPLPTVLVYLVFAAIFVAQAVGVLFMPESVTPRPGALASLRPQFRLPPKTRAAMWLAVPAMIAAWALVGFHASLGPALARRLADSSSLFLGGIALFVLAASGSLTVLLARARSASELLAGGNAVLVAGAVLTLVAIASSSVVLFFLSLALSGAGIGAGFQGAIRTVVPLASPHERAGVLSIVYVVAYLSMGAPAVIGGVRVVYGGGVVATAREYVVAVIALAAMALAGTILRARHRARAGRAGGVDVVGWVGRARGGGGDANAVRVRGALREVVLVARAPRPRAERPAAMRARGASQAAGFPAGSTTSLARARRSAQGRRP